MSTISEPIEIRLRKVVHVLTSPGLSMPLSGISVTRTLPDGTEMESIFSEDYADKDIVDTLFAKLDPALRSDVKVTREPQRIIVYHAEPKQIV